MMAVVIKKGRGGGGEEEPVCVYETRIFWDTGG